MLPVAASPTAAPRDLVEEVAHALAAVRAEGAGRVSDTFVLPVDRGGRYRGRRSVLTVDVAYRGHRETCYVRCDRGPFDLLSFPVGSPERRGAWFSLGPGLRLHGEHRQVHPLVLLAQLEGPAQEVLPHAARIEETLRRFGRDPHRHDGPVGDDEAVGLRVCLALALPAGDDLPMTWPEAEHTPDAAPCRPDLGGGPAGVTR